MARREFDRDSVKLHMTLIKATKSSKGEDGDDDDDGNNRNKIRSKNFDARHILDKYADYKFGEQLITEIQLAILKSNDTQNSFYKCTTSIQF